MTQRHKHFFFQSLLIGCITLGYLWLSSALYSSHSQHSKHFDASQRLCSTLIQSLANNELTSATTQIISVSYPQLKSEMLGLKQTGALNNQHSEAWSLWSEAASPALLAATTGDIHNQNLRPLLLATAKLNAELDMAYSRATANTLQQLRDLSLIYVSLLLAILAFGLIYEARKKLAPTDTPKGKQVSAKQLRSTKTNKAPAVEAPSISLHKILPQLIENPDSVEPLNALLGEIELPLDASSSAIFLTADNPDPPSLLVCSYLQEQDTHIAAAREFYDKFSQTQQGPLSLYSASYDSDYKMLGIRLFYGQPATAGALLLLKVDKATQLTQGQASLLKDHCDLLSSMIHISQFFKLKLRDVQYEERAAIARELHDSIAQSLSYLKIQASRLQSMLNSSSALNKHNLIQIDLAVQELRESINIAYRHLRELLTTFRLTMDGKSFSCAVEDSIKEFGKRCSIVFELDNRLADGELSVAEEMQLLHIMREAVSNVVRHSHAKYSRITLLGQSNGMVSMTIDDDGIGLAPADERENHHGLIIMQERTRSIGGTLKIDKRDDKGTRVNITFQAVKYAKPQGKTNIA